MLLNLKEYIQAIETMGRWKIITGFNDNKVPNESSLEWDMKQRWDRSQAEVEEGET